MSKFATKDDLQEMYSRMLPYLGGQAEAGFTPVGTVISVMGNTAPANYLACDGSTHNIADYPELAAYFLQQFESKNYFGGDGTTTFAVPDLRGEFLRGTGTNGHENQGSGADVGTHQDGTEIPNIYFDTNGNNFALMNEKPDAYEGTATAFRNYDSGIKGNGTLDYVARSSSTPVANADAYRIPRPTNTSVLYCIATKNIYLNPAMDYSTDEKVVGTWIDGSPLYQKTVQFGALPNTVTSKSVEHGISNLKKIVKIEGYSYAYDSGNRYTWPMPGMYNSSGDLRVCVATSATLITIYTSVSGLGVYTETDITLQYVKN